MRNQPAEFSDLQREKTAKRNAKLSPERRSEIARKAGKAARRSYGAGNIANDSPLRRMIARQQSEREARQRRLEQWARHDEDVLTYRREARRKGKKAERLHEQLMAGAMEMFTESFATNPHRKFHVSSRSTTGA